MANPQRQHHSLIRLPDMRLSPEARNQLEKLREQFRSIIEDSERFSERMRETVKLAIPEGFKLPSWEEQDENYRARLKMLAENGWFAGMEFPLVTLNKADAMFRQGQEEQANVGLTGYFDAKASEIVKEVSALYPETSTLMARALRAHQEADFTVSVMILLAQAEGIWGRHASFSPYSRAKDNKEALQKAIDGKASQLPIRAYWELLLQDIPINRKFDKSQPEPQGLNRHAVMHGASLNFGTKINSARALSWLSYTAEIRCFFGLFERNESPVPSFTTQP
jgi:hypothetical protein